MYYKNQIKNNLILFIFILPIIYIISSQYLYLIKEAYRNNITEISTFHEIIVYTKKPISDVFDIESEVDIGDALFIKGRLKKDMRLNEFLEVLSYKSGFAIYGIQDVSCDLSYLYNENYIFKLNNKNIDIDYDLIKIKKDMNTFQIQTNSCFYINPGMLQKIFKNNDINTIILIKNGNHTN